MSIVWFLLRLIAGILALIGFIGGAIFWHMGLSMAGMFVHVVSVCLAWWSVAPLFRSKS